MNMHDKAVAWAGGVIGWGGTVLASIEQVEAYTRIFAGLGAGFASICTGLYFIHKYFTDK